MAGKYGIGARVRDEDGDEGVIVGKRKGSRDVRYDTGIAAGFVVTKVGKSFLTPLAANDDTPARAEQAQGEPKIEVGDRVRCTKDYDPGVQFTAGKEYVVRYVTTDSIGVVADDSGDPNGWSRKYFELVTEPDWQPKVGDRVRFTDECREYWWFGPQKKYKDGTVSKTDGGGELPIHVKCSNGETAFVNADQIEPLPVDAEAQGAGTLKIQAGKFYRTRDGRKVGPAEHRPGSSQIYPMCDWVIDGVLYQDDGTFAEGGYDEYDLVAEWPSENPVAVAPATATPDAPARTFKVGDRVRVKCGDLTGTIASRNSAGAMAIRYDGGDHVGFQFWRDDELEPADTPVSAVVSDEAFSDDDLVELTIGELTQALADALRVVARRAAA